MFNNNVVLARDGDGREVVLTGRGLGFGTGPGEPVDAGRVQQTFVPDATHDTEQLSAFLTELPPEHLIVMNLSGRGDKDIFTVADALKVTL